MSEKLLLCNECGKRKLYYNTQKQIGWCHVCSRVVTKEEVQDGTESSFEYGFNVHATQGSEDPWEHEKARTYLQGRYVEHMDCLRVGIRYDPDRQTIRIPIHSPAVEYPPSFQSRSIGIGGQWYTESKEREHYCFGWLWLKPDLKELIVVEGIFDVLSPGWLGYAIASLGTNVSDTLVLAISSRFDRVLCWYDPDAAGRKGGRLLQRKLQASGCRVTNVESPIEPGDMSSEHPDAQRIKLEVISYC